MTQQILKALTKIHRKLFYYRYGLQIILLEKCITIYFTIKMHCKLFYNKNA